MGGRGFDGKACLGLWFVNGHPECRDPGLHSRILHCSEMVSVVYFNHLWFVADWCTSTHKSQEGLSPLTKKSLPVNIQMKICSFNTCVEEVCQVKRKSDRESEVEVLLELCFLRTQRVKWENKQEAPKKTTGTYPLSGYNTTSGKKMQNGERTDSLWNDYYWCGFSGRKEETIQQDLNIFK